MRDGMFNIGQPHRLSVAQNRHHQATLSGYGDANIHVLFHGWVSFEQTIEKLTNGFGFYVDRSFTIRSCS